MTTIKQVAKRARVSSATVSRVLNNDQRVSPAYRERVNEAIAELGYRPNRIARNLRRKATDTIGVVVSDIENPHFTRAVRAIEDAAYQQGYRVILCNTDETPEKQRAYLEVLAAEQVIGVIIAPADPSDTTISALIDMNIPVVAFDRSVDDERADAVFADNILAVRRATEHLIRLGRRSIGFIAGRLEIQTGVDRLRGYEETMREHDLPTAVGHGGFRMELANQATQHLLADHPELDALIVANNLMAIGALTAIRAAGRRVPDEIAIVGIDNPPWADLIDPPMTTFGQPIHQMATTAFTLLVERISRERTQSRFVIFNFEPQIRESCGSGAGSEARPRASAIHPSPAAHGDGHTP